MKAVLVVALALVVVPAAHGKGCARIESTTPLTVGRPATITLTTLMPSYASDGTLLTTRPYADGTVVMSMYLKPRFGLPVLLQLVRDPSNRSQWRAPFVFRRPGTWTLSSTAIPPGMPQRCTGTKRVSVHGS